MPPMAGEHIAADLAGGLAALGSAAAWALGSILFRRVGEVASPEGMNLAKSALGVGLLLAVSALSGGLGLGGAAALDGHSLLLLALSGLVGIALGDTLFFMALVRLEPRRTLLLATVGQVFTVLLAVVFLGERLAGLAWVGVALVLGGVAWVMQEQLDEEDTDEARARTRGGLIYGLLASLCMSLSVLLADQGVAGLSALDATWMRLLAGMVGVAAWGAVRGQLRGWLAPLWDGRLLWQMLGAVCVIIFGGFYLSLLSLKLTTVSISTVLTATEPLFILPLTYVLLRERISLRAALGALIAVAGVGLLLSTLG